MVVDLVLSAVADHREALVVNGALWFGEERSLVSGLPFLVAPTAVALLVTQDVVRNRIELVRCHADCPQPDTVLLNSETGVATTARLAIDARGPVLVYDTVDNPRTTVVTCESPTCRG